MAKTPSKKSSAKPDAKASASYSAKASSETDPATDNASKYQPTEDADMDLQQLDPEDGLLKLFTDSIKDIYWSENHLVKALPKMAKAASTKTLQGAITNHWEQTKTHVERLEQVFDSLGKKPQAKKCDAMEGLTKEGEGIVENTDANTAARDLGIIMASQKVEHYEISAYMGLSKLAVRLGLKDVTGILSETLAEEQESDEILASIADNDIPYSDNQED